MTKTETVIQVVGFILDGVFVFSVGKNSLKLASKNTSTRYATASSFGEMSLSDAAKYNQFWDNVAIGKTVDQRMGVENVIDKLILSGKLRMSLENI